MIVFILCAIVITVDLENSSFIKLNIFYSVSTSIFAVASSKITILFYLKMALQIHINYFSPTERLVPPSSIFKSKPEGPDCLPRFNNSSKPAFTSTCSSFSFVVVEKGSRLYLSVPLKSVGS